MPEILATTSDLVPTSSEPLSQPVSWQHAMKLAIRSAVELRRVLGLETLPCPRSAEDFPTFVPWEFVRRMKPGDPEDPLLRQVLPLVDEDSNPDGFISDPVGDLGSVAAGGLLHKYAGRALLVSTGACGIHCRYCFRREFPYSEFAATNDRWREAVTYLAGQPSIDEVILSGGDPLTLVDVQLFRLIDELESIDHLKRLRIHSRMPIVIPQRITESLINRLRDSRLAVWMVIHCNHPQELDADVWQAIELVQKIGVPVLNQAVLLRGVNDRAETMIELCRTLVDHQVQPYYLHQLDRVRGAAHFEVSPAKGLRIIERLRQTLPGYAVPKYVREVASESAKTPIYHLKD